MKTFIRQTKRRITLGDEIIKKGTPITVSDVREDLDSVVYFTSPSWWWIPDDYLSHVKIMLTE